MFPIEVLLLLGALLVIVLLGGAVLLLAVFLRWRRCRTSRETQVEYPSPDFGSCADFKIERYPRSEILYPLRYWLINGNTAEIEYYVVPSQFARLRVAEIGNLNIPVAFRDEPYQSVAEFPLDGIRVELYQSPAGRQLLYWQRGEFDYALIAATPQMNMIGGVSETFVSETLAVRTRPRLDLSQIITQSPPSPDEDDE